MNRLYDCHLHTSFSSDSDTPPLSQVRAAENKGLSGITITDHLDLDYTDDPSLFQLDLPSYLKEMREIIRGDKKRKIDVLVGVELGLQPHLAARHRAVLKETDPDFVIGSVHICLGKDPYYDAFYKNKPPREAYLAYFGSVLNNIRAFSDFDSLGHLDYIVRYAKRYYGEMCGAYSYRDYADVIDPILSFLIRHDIALEVNTGSYREGLKEPNPSVEVLKRYYALGGRLITLGADAHIPSHVGLAFDSLPDLLKSIGFKSFFVYKKRRAVDLPLP